MRHRVTHRPTATSFRLEQKGGPIMRDPRSLLERTASLVSPENKEFAAVLSDQQLGEFPAAWTSQARPAQLAPTVDWDTWLILAGRGFGKTRAGAGWVHQVAVEVPGARIALLGATAADARAVMVEGESGLLAKAPADAGLAFEPSLRRLTWANSSTAWLYSAAEPEALRGPQFHFAWGDEVARWSKAPDALANLRLALRLGSRPQLLLTTTPRPLGWLKTLTEAAGVIVTRGATHDNAADLPGVFLSNMQRDYGGTRLGRQELGGEIIDDLEGALWTRALLEDCRTGGLPLLRRVVVAVDPPASSGVRADACGIVVAGLGNDGRGYVIADDSIQGLAPEQWAAAVVAAAQRHDADRVVAEVNNGGDMVVSVLRAVASTLPVKPVRAAVGKVARAEPVASLYAAGRVSHVGAFPALEDELCGMMIGGDYAGPGRSPDRADALVWALTELLLGPAPNKPGIQIL